MAKRNRSVEADIIPAEPGWLVTVEDADGPHNFMLIGWTVTDDGRVGPITPDGIILPESVRGYVKNCTTKLADNGQATLDGRR